MSAHEVSHGRGGAGNIGKDETAYTDGEVTRTGAVGSHQDGAFSTGRGGAANIGDVGIKTTARQDKEVIPAEATRPSMENADYHVGRGGAGNAHLAPGHDKKHEKAPVPAAAPVNGTAKTATDEAPLGLAERLKRKLFGAFKKS